MAELEESWINDEMMEELIGWARDEGLTPAQAAGVFIAAAILTTLTHSTEVVTLEELQKLLELNWHSLRKQIFKT